MLYCAMRHRTQLYLDDDQYRWLKRQAARAGSIAQVVRDLIDTARAADTPSGDDVLIRFLLEEPPGEGGRPTTVTDLDRDLYGT
jgi:hypothetical protein